MCCNFGFFCYRLRTQCDACAHANFGLAAAIQMTNVSIQMNELQADER